MQYGVVIQISRRSVTSWYRTERNRYAPLMVKGLHEVPLYFYVKDNQFDFGANARDRFFQHDPYAFGDYFELIKDPSRHFTLHNSPKRAKQLLYYGIEQHLSHFLNTVLYKSDSIESYRADLPLKFIFEPDLAEPEQSVVAGLFTEAGYRTVSVLHYNQILLKYLRQIRYLQEDNAALLLTGLNDTLYLELYLKGSCTAAATMAIEGQGADPRIRILSEMIIDYVQEQNPHLYLNAGKEIKAVLPFAAALLTGSQPIVNGDVELTDGNAYWFSVNLKSVEERLQYHTGDLLVNTSVNDLVQKAMLNSGQVVALLVSGQIQTPYFSQRLLNGFPHVGSITATQKEGAMQLIFDQVNGMPEVKRSTPPKAPPLPPAPVKPQLPVAKKVAPATQAPPLPAKINTPRNILPPPLPKKKI